MNGCTNKESSSNFQIPKIVNTQLLSTTKKITLAPDSLVDVFPPFIGKSKFGDIVDLSRENRDTSYQKDYLPEYRLSDDDSLHVNRLELLVDYKTEVYYNRFFEYDSTLFRHYPVYFINSSNTNKVFVWYPRS